jgi:hypothetical protein
MPVQHGAGSLAQGPDRGAIYRIDRERRLIVVTYIGPVTLGIIRAIQGMAARDPEFDASFAVLVDGRRGDFDALSADDLREVARNTPCELPARRAFLVSSQANAALAKSFAEISAADGRPFPFALFDSLEDALRWLWPVRVG